MANEDLKQEILELMQKEKDDLERVQLLNEIQELKKKKWIRENPRKARFAGMFGR